MFGNSSDFKHLYLKLKTSFLNLTSSIIDTLTWFFTSVLTKKRIYKDKLTKHQMNMLQTSSSTQSNKQSPHLHRAEMMFVRVTETHRETHSESQADQVLRRYILQSVIALQIPDFLFMEVDYQSNQWAGKVMKYSTVLSAPFLGSPHYK